MPSDRVAGWVTLLGLAAGTLTTVAYLPQVVKTWRSRSTGDLSLAMFLVMVTGNLLWLAYGLTIGDLPLVAANAVSTLLQGIVLGFKLRYG